MSLTESAMLFDTYYQKNQSEESIDQNNEDTSTRTRRQLITLTDHSKMIVRTVPAALRVPYFIASTDAENFYYSLLIQYILYRAEAELLQGFYSAREAFLAQEEQLKAISGHIEQHRERDQQLEVAFNQVHAFQILELPPVLNNIEHTEDYPEQAMTNDQFDSARQAMNMDQRQLFNNIT
ncbi:unnamed protein product [Parnassius apollo]|uniref:(apollo) hypothetical protein n=1 Tax=Parnassius apollo TaxID=110799 RepID=A0A8S3XZ63_PARAO|nr:unnamed protein product [Parnassius apollo]